MASFIENNMYYVTGQGHSRIPREPMGANPGLAALIPPIIHATGASPTTVFYSNTPQPSYSLGGQTYFYAFTSMSGGTEGGMVGVLPTVGSPMMAMPLLETVNASGGDITQLNVYLPTGGFGIDGGDGAIIDAFDEATGSFVNDIFVTVAPDDAAGDVTHDANYLGVVDTDTQTEQVTAYGYLTVSAIQFDKWLKMPTTGGATDTISGTVFSAGQNTNVVAFAYYRVPPKGKEGHKELIKEVEYTYKNIADIVKSPKENAENNPYGDLGDPAYLTTQVAALVSKVALLETQLAEMGRAFIRTQNRPDVGGEITGMANDRG